MRLRVILKIAMGGYVGFGDDGWFWFCERWFVGVCGCGRRRSKEKGGEKGGKETKKISVTRLTALLKTFKNKSPSARRCN